MHYLQQPPVGSGGYLVPIVYGVGLPGYLILFATHAFAPQRQIRARDVAFATGVPPDIYAFHRYT